MVESLIGMGRCFSWGLVLLFLALALYALIRNALISPTPFMAIVSDLLPIGASMVVAGAVGAYLGSWFDSILGVDQVFATAGIVGGSVFGIVWWRRGDVNQTRRP